LPGRPNALVEFVHVINVNIRDFHQEIRKAVDEFTGEFYYVLVSVAFNKKAQLSLTNPRNA